MAVFLYTHNTHMNRKKKQEKKNTSKGRTALTNLHNPLIMVGIQ